MSRAGSTPVASGRPLRTCLGCRRVRPQAELLRLVRSAEGSVEPDPARRRGGRGAYLCRSASCLDEAVRRSRWGHAFRGPAIVGPETVARLRALIEPRLQPLGASPGREHGIGPAVRAGRRSATPAEGRW